MNYLAENPIADMQGPTFLVFYAVVAVIVLVVARVGLNWLDSSRGLPAPSGCHFSDALELAYLRGGAEEVLRVMALDLIQRGYLQAPGGESRELRAVNNAPDRSLLSPEELALFSRCAGGVSTSDLLKSSVCSLIEERYEGYRQQMEREQLLATPSYHQGRRLTGFGAGLLLIALAAYKIWVACNKGHYNVGFLIVMAFLVLPVTVFLFRYNRLSHRGLSYIKDLGRQFKDLRKRVRDRYSQASDTEFLVAAALFGPMVLSGTAYGDLYDAFRPPPSANGGCSGGGCSGGGGCGGGGCGGGCGGCGG